MGSREREEFFLLGQAWVASLKKMTVAPHHNQKATVDHAFRILLLISFNLRI